MAGDKQLLEKKGLSFTQHNILTILIEEKEALHTLIKTCNIVRELLIIEPK